MDYSFLNNKSDKDKIGHLQAYIEILNETNNKYKQNILDYKKMVDLYLNMKQIKQYKTHYNPVFDC